MAHIANLIAELRRRRVFRVAGLYIVGAWVVLQASDLFLESLGFPDTALLAVWIALLAGFPLALLFGWRYDITAQGIVRTKSADQGTAESTALKWPDFVILGALALIGCAAAYNAVTRISEVAIGHIDFGTSIAVMPLDNLSGEPDYFAEGMHDALITTLSKIPQLRVTSRTSTLRVGNELSVPEIARTLGVTSIVEGSVTREGNRVRVNVQLINAANDSHIWAESYERDFAGVLTMQREMARAIASAVRIRIAPEDERYFAAAPTNPETLEAYLRGMFQLRKETPAGYERGIEILTEAVGNDPGSGLAWAGLAAGYAKLGHNPYPVEGMYPRARAAADRAIELDPTLAEAHFAVAMFKLYYEYDFTGAEDAFLQAIDINPSLVDAHYHYAWLLELLGRDEEAIAFGIRTKELDPLSSFYTAWLGGQYLDAGRFDDALAEARSVLDLDPDYPVAWLVLGMTYADMGKFDLALEAHEHLRNSYFFSYALAGTLATAGQADEALAIAERIEARAPSGVPLSLIYASLGDRERTFEWLRFARERKEPWYPWLVAWFPEMSRYHDDPELQAHADELGLPLRQGSTGN